MAGKLSRIAHLRLHRQRIAGKKSETPAEAVAWLGAVQAQDYAAALWAIGLRTRDSTALRVEQAIAERRIVRTWPMRGTLHFLAAEDARWMTALLAPRVIANNQARLLREFGLDDSVLARCRKVLTKALGDGLPLTRSEVYARLDKAGISTERQRGIHITGRLAQEGLLCLGPRADKQPTFVLMEQWIPKGREMQRDQALAELARRYFHSHGPATVQDFTWWSGLTVKDVQLGIELASADLTTEVIGGKTYLHSGQELESDDASEPAQLLPAFDEYIVAYKDRSEAVEPRFSRQLIGINGLFNASVVIGGLVAGTWKRGSDKSEVAVELNPFRPLLKREMKSLDKAIQRYRDFIGK